MIIQPTQIEQNGITFNRLTYNQPFYAVGYGADKVVRLITAEDEVLEASTIISGKLNGFGSESFTELLAECQRRGLKGVEQALEN
jgi:hypothetical protein